MPVCTRKLHRLQVGLLYQRGGKVFLNPRHIPPDSFMNRGGIDIECPLEVFGKLTRSSMECILSIIRSCVLIKPILEPERLARSWVAKVEEGGCGILRLVQRVFQPDKGHYEVDNVVEDTYWG